MDPFVPPQTSREITLSLSGTCACSPVCAVCESPLTWTSLLMVIDTFGSRLHKSNVFCHNCQLRRRLVGQPKCFSLVDYLNTEDVLLPIHPKKIKKESKSEHL